MRMTIGKKIGSGFALVLALLCAVSLMAFFGVKGIVGNADESIGGNQLDGELAQREVDHLVWVDKVNAFLNDNRIKKLNVQLDPHKCGFGRWFYGEGRKAAEKQTPSLAPLLKAIEQPHILLHRSATKIEKLNRHPHPGLLSKLYAIYAKHLVWAAKLADRLSMLASGKAGGPAFELGVQFNPAQCALGSFLAKPETQKLAAGFPALAQAVEEMAGPHRTMHESAAKIQELARSGRAEEALRVYQTQTKPSLEKMKAGLFKAIRAEEELLQGAALAMERFQNETKPSLEKVQKLLHAIRKEAKANILSDEVMLQRARGVSLWVILLSTAALLVGILLSWLITRALTKPLVITKEAVERAAQGDFTFESDQALLSRSDELGDILRSLAAMSENLSNTVRRVREASDVVALTAGEISQSNQDLSQRSQEQASAVEQTASSLEQLTGSVKQNASNSQTASRLANSTAQMAEKGGQVVAGAVKAMAEVNTASHKISEIIGLVNEIAFQTNLLALNAAVEAARAGEAGRGFAVVAGEVRNLASRSAAAAKQIQALIDDSVAKAETSDRLVGESGELLTEIIKNVREVADTIAEMSAASGEQASGIEEINSAVSQMDEAVQQNAAMVEEAASASENMAAVAEELKQIMAFFQLKDQGGYAKPRAALPPGDDMEW